MKKYFFVLLIALLASSEVFAQGYVGACGNGPTNIRCTCQGLATRPRSSPIWNLQTSCNSDMISGGDACDSHYECGAGGSYLDPLWLLQLIGLLRAQQFDSIRPHRYEDTGWVEYDSDKMSAFFHFEKLSDEGVSNYFIGDLRKNGKRIKWKSWHYDTIFQLGPTLLMDSSCTDSFYLATGDEITFYREFNWYDLANHEQTTDNYYCPQELSYSVELISPATGQRIECIDSMRLIEGYGAAPPTVYGNRQIIATVSFVVPSSLNGESVILRIVPKQSGTGINWYYRKDGWALNMSDRANQSWVSTYLADYGSGWNYVAPKISESHTTSFAKSNLLSIYPNPAESGHVTVSVPREYFSNKRVEIRILDLAGKSIASSVPKLEGDWLGSMFELSHSGVYVAALFVDDRLLDAEKVTVR